MARLLFLVICGLFWVRVSAATHKPIRFADGTGCPPVFKQKCRCGPVGYYGKQRWVLNCTDTGFLSEEPLNDLPPETEVVIYTGNRLTDLQPNIFGTTNEGNFTKLRILDFTGNQIQDIPGKTFHKVAYVERLILNHNQLKIEREHHHGRLFSNFYQLKELHLTNAFADNQNLQLEDLDDIFLKSNLTHVIKLHLEQNELRSLGKPDIFCRLPKLMDLHLGDNLFDDIDLDITCFPQLRYIDLERNRLQSVRQKLLTSWDHAVTNTRNLTVNLGENPFKCNCDLVPFIKWLNTTRVHIKDPQRLICTDATTIKYQGSNIYEVDPRELCDVYSSGASSHSSATVIVLTVLSVILVLCSIALAYMHRESIWRKVRPLTVTVIRRMQYSTIDVSDYPEVDV